MSSFSIPTNRLKESDLKKVTVQQGSGRDKYQKEYYVDKQGNLFEKEYKDRGPTTFSHLDKEEEANAKREIQKSIDEQLQKTEKLSSITKAKNIFGNELVQREQELKELNAMLDGGAKDTAAINILLNKVKDPEAKAKAKAALQKQQPKPVQQPQVQAPPPAQSVAPPQPAPQQVQETQRQEEQERIQQELLDKSQERIKNQQRKEPGESPFLDPFRNKNRFHAMGSPTTYL